MFDVPPGERVVVKLRLTCDFTTALIRKTLMVQTNSFVQRFPIQVNIDKATLAFANRNSHHGSFTNPVLGSTFELQTLFFKCMIVFMLIQLWDYLHDQTEKSKGLQRKSATSAFNAMSAAAN